MLRQREEDTDVQVRKSLEFSEISLKDDYE
jgi:hypothetical protein